MDKGPAPRLIDERGFSSVQFLLASMLALVLFLTFANLVVVQYGRGAVRSALEQGARAGTISGAVACEETANRVVGDLLGGRMSDELVITCAANGTSMVATGVATFESWTPLTPDFPISITASAFVEP